MAKRILDGKGNFATCLCKRTDVKRTIPDLAMTPQQIAEMAARGVPVSSKSMQQYYEGMATDNHWSIEPMFKRGADINQLWEIEKTSQEKILNARRKEAIKYR